MSNLLLDGWRSALRSERYEMSAISQVFTQRNTPTDSTLHEPLSVGKEGVTEQLENISKSLKTDGRKLVVEGDVVINSRSDRRGASGLASRTGSVSLIYIVLEPRLDRIDPRYAHHLIRSKAFQDEFYRFGTGIVADLWSTRYERMSQIRIPLPPLEVQQRIADYLDRENTEIDGAVADLHRYVELLEKRREALVADTLTRIARRGDSEVLGPSTTNIGRVGLVSTLIRRGISPSYVDDGIPVINQKCVRPGGWLDYESCRFHDPEARSLPEGLYLREGDVLINSTGTGTLGRSCVVTDVDQKTTWDSHVTLVRPNLDDVSPAYLGWVIASHESRLIEFSVGSTNQIELSRDIVVNLDIPLPSLGVQHEVAEYLNRETTEIDSLIVESKKLRDLLLKRRSVLSTEVVTGRKQI